MAAQYSRALWRIVTAAALSCSGACTKPASGGAPEYEYPRTRPDAVPTHHGLRVRVTQHGLDLMTQGLPEVLAGMCSATDQNASCGLDSETAPKEARFFIGSPEAPVGVDILGYSIKFRAGELAPFDPHSGEGLRPYCDDTGGDACLMMLARGMDATLEGAGFCRHPSAPTCTSPASDYCCGESSVCTLGVMPTSCRLARSSIGLDLVNLSDNIKLQLRDDVAGGGISMVLGCDAPNPADCTDPSEYVRGHLDLSAVFGGSSVCRYRDTDPATGSFEIKTLRVTLRPQIKLDDKGRTRLAFDAADAEVTASDIEFHSVTGAPANEDPLCYGTGGCSGCFDLPIDLLSWLTSGFLGNTIASGLVSLVARQAVNTTLDTAMPLDMNQLIVGSASRASLMGLLVAGNLETPSYSGLGAALGMNVDLDFGIFGGGSACVPEVEPPAGWELPEAPSPGLAVLAPSATGGAKQEVPYSAAIIIGDTVLNRAFYVFFNSGSLCLNLHADTIAGLTGGAFAPTLSAFSLFAPRLSRLGPGATPVDIQLRPSAPPKVIFGNAEGSGETRNSHVKLSWPGVHIDIVPRVDEAMSRAFGFGFDVVLNASLEPRSDGALYVVVDKLEIANLEQTYDESGINFDLKGVSDLLGVFMPMLLGGAPMRFDLSTQSLGLPAVPKVRTVDLLGFDGRYLGAFFELCLPSQIADPTNTLCYEATSKGLGTRHAPVSFELAQVQADAEPPRVLVRARGVSQASDLELAFRVDGVGPLFSFRATENGLFTIEHPALAWPGKHEIELVARYRTAPLAWQEAGTLGVTIDRAPPELRASRAGSTARSTSDGGDGSATGCAVAPSGWACGPALLLGLGAALRRRLRRRC